MILLGLIFVLYLLKDESYHGSPYDTHADFEMDYKEGKEYIIVYGRKMEWFQYNPGKKSQFGGLANRIGVDWEGELRKDTVYIYEYDEIEDGYLAIMSIEF